MQLMKAALLRNATKIVSRTSSTINDAVNFDRPRVAYEDAKSFKQIPGPRSLPFVGTLWSYFLPFNKYSLKTLHSTYENMCLEYGILVRERQGPKRIILHVFGAEDILTVYRNDGYRPYRVSHQALGKYRRERPHLYAREGLLSSNNEEWWDFRKMFNGVMNGNRMEFLKPVLEDVIDQMLETFPRRLDENNEIGVMPLFYKWGLESIGRIMLNKRIGCLDVDPKPEVDALINAAQETHINTSKTENLHIGKGRFHKRLQKAQDIFSEIVGRYLDEALQNVHKTENENCVLANMLKQKPDVDRRDLLTMTIDAFLGGIDNTSCALSMNLYNLARNKQAQDTLREELMKVMPTKDIRLSDIEVTQWSKNRKYLDAVIMESHRVTPATLGNGRVTTKDLVLSGYQVPAKTFVILQHQAASKLERHFTDAHLFKPERFLGEISPTDSRTSRAVIQPFGSGPRACIGMAIAQMELMLAISKIIRNYEISYHHEDVGFKTVLMNKPDTPVTIRFKKVQY